MKDYNELYIDETKYKKDILDDMKAVEITNVVGNDYSISGSDFDFSVNWTENGLFFIVEGTTTLGHVYDVKGEDFRRLFPRFELEYIFDEDIVRLKIKIWDIPKSFYKKSSPREKALLTNFLESDFKKFYGFFEYISQYLLDIHMRII
jgi:hypothetical protein